MRLSPVLAVLVALSLGPCAAAQELRRYEHPATGFSLGLPLDRFAVVSESGGRLALVERGGTAQLDVFGVENPEALSLGQFRSMMETADPTRRITYRAAGRSWFVLSGYLEGEPEPTIFYAKFMLNRAGTALSAFEISYPRARRAQFDPLVERLEDSLTAPR